MSKHVLDPPYNKRFVLTGLHFLLNFSLGRPAAQTQDRYKAGIPINISIINKAQ
jgi:hypothetical protein